MLNAIMSTRLFPNLKNARWFKINLDGESRETGLDLPNPKVCFKWIESLHKKYKVNCSYGGFGENRAYLWRNLYPGKTGKSIHLGVDYNVPVGTDVALISDVHVEEVWQDSDQNGGWGTRILARILEKNSLGKELWIIYGHLASDVNVEEGRKYAAGTLLGRIGESNENGGWFPHLHLQLMDFDFISCFSGRFNEIDGYAYKKDKLLRHVYNPGVLKFNF